MSITARARAALAPAAWASLAASVSGRFVVDYHDYHLFFKRRLRPLTRFRFGLSLAAYPDVGLPTAQAFRDASTAAFDTATAAYARLVDGARTRAAAYVGEDVDLSRFKLFVLSAIVAAGVAVGAAAARAIAQSPFYDPDRSGNRRQTFYTLNVPDCVWALKKCHACPALFGSLPYCIAVEEGRCRAFLVSCCGVRHSVSFSEDEKVRTDIRDWVTSACALRVCATPDWVTAAPRHVRAEVDLLAE